MPCSHVILSLWSPESPASGNQNSKDNIGSECQLRMDHILGDMLINSHHLFNQQKQLYYDAAFRDEETEP